MRTFQLNMLGYQRPVIELFGQPSIIDTGAVIPMTSMNVDLMKLAWNAELVMDNISIGGIGGRVSGKIYALKNFQIGDLFFDKLEIFRADEPDTKYGFLLSATLFRGLEYSFNMKDDYNQTFIVNIPKEVSNHRVFEVKSLEGQLYVQLDGILIQDEIKPLNIITNYTQEISEYNDYE